MVFTGPEAQKLGGASEDMSINIVKTLGERRKST